jgi:hypothetical protein
VVTGGAGSSVVSGQGAIVVGRVEEVVVGVVVRLGVVDREVEVGGRVVAGPLPPLPVAKTISP